MDIDGNAIAVWHQSDGTRTNIWANRHTPSTGWGAAELIEDNDEGEGNIHIEPTFTTGPFGDYYLSQTVAGQLIDGTCVDLGNAGANPEELAIETYTTRTDSVPDASVLDMGAHYPALPALPISLTIAVITVSWQSLKASRMNPAASIKVE